jgi:hypothetical protein
MSPLAFTLLIAVAAWLGLRAHDQRTRIALLGRHLAGLQLERLMETLTQGYTRAIHEPDASRQLQVLESFAQAERSVAVQTRALADVLRQENETATRISLLPVYVPYADRVPSVPTGDFRALLRLHAVGLRHVTDNESHWDAKTRAFHLSAELYLFQHSCHWFCKSRSIANARLALRHQVTHQKVLDSVSEVTRAAYLAWLRGGD